MCECGYEIAANIGCIRYFDVPPLKKETKRKLSKTPEKA